MSEVKASIVLQSTHQDLWVSLDMAQVGVHKVMTQELQKHLLALRVTELSLHTVGQYRRHMALQLWRTYQ